MEDQEVMEVDITEVDKVNILLVVFRLLVEAAAEQHIWQQQIVESYQIIIHIEEKF